MGTIVGLLTKYQEFFPTIFFVLKGIIRDLGVMNITVKPDARPIKQHPYILKPKYKQKVKEEMEKMVFAGVLEPVEESEWVSHMVFQEKKKKGEIRICVNLHKFNDVCVHDPF